MIELEQIASQAEAAIAAATELSVLDDLRVEYLGKKGKVTSLLKGLGALSNEERPAAGAKINEVKQSLQAKINQQKEQLETVALNAKLAGETIDVTLPGRGEEVGGLHPVTRTMERIEAFFAKIGYDVELAENGQVGVEKALHKSYDMILMDCSMKAYGAIPTIPKASPSSAAWSFLSSRPSFDSAIAIP